MTRLSGVEDMQDGSLFRFFPRWRKEGGMKAPDKGPLETSKVGTVP